MIIHDEFEQYSDEYWAGKLGKPSASVAEKMVSNGGKVSTQYKDLAASLAADLFAGKQLDTFSPTQAMERGTRLEEQARDYFSFVTDIEVTEVGFVSDDLERIVVSPDGMLNSGVLKIKSGVLEIKNLTAKKHVQALDYYDKHGKSQLYNSQMQMQMMVCEVKKGKLLYHHPDLPSLIIDIKADDEFHALLKKQITVTITERDRLIKIMEKLR